MTVSFSELNLNDNILRAINDAKYTTPTPIQSQAIPAIIDGKDVIGIAQTGTGKTASFTLPMIQALSKGRARARMPRSVIITPTRELAMQIHENVKTYSKYCSLQTALLIGGSSYGKQDKDIQRGVDILICTPGRLLDHIENGKLLLNGIEILAIDEADRMLDMGFIPDVKKILQRTPVTRQTLLFSATLNKEIEKLIHQFLFNPTFVKVENKNNAASTIEQFSIKLPNNSPKVKKQILKNIMEKNESQSVIVFCNRKRTVDALAVFLQKNNINALPIHGDLSQGQRTSTLNKYRKGSVKILVASDVAARGLDIEFVSHVYNYDVPIKPDDYVHRIGRTGRAGRKGTSFLLVSPADSVFFKQVTNNLKLKNIAELPFSDYTDGIEENELSRDFVSKNSDSKPNRNSRGGGQQRSRSSSRSRGGESRGGDRSDRPRDDRPRGDRSDRPRGGDRSDRPRGDRSDRPRNDRPRDDRPRSDRPRDDRPRGDRPRGGDRSDRPRSDSPRDDRPRGDRPRGDRSDRPRDDRPRGDRPRGDRSDRPRDDRPRGDRPRGDRSDRPRDDRPHGGKPRGGDRSDRPRDDRPRGDRPRGDRSDRPRDDRPRGDRPRGGDRSDRPRDDRPHGGKPRGGDRSDRPRGDRSDRPRGGGSDRPRGGDRPHGGKPRGGDRSKPSGSKPQSSKPRDGEGPRKSSKPRDGDAPRKQNTSDEKKVSSKKQGSNMPKSKLDNISFLKK